MSSTTTTAGVRNDLRCLQDELRGCGDAYTRLLRVDVCRPLLDIAFDATVIALAVLACAHISAWLSPLAVLFIGNRQRSLGNILHDGSHGNLHRSRELNDLILRVLLAPLLFLSVAKYRSDHARHHALLGDPDGDPDMMQRDARRSWVSHYLHYVLDRRSWWSSLAAHLGRQTTSLSARLTIVAWWLGLDCAIGAVAGPRFLGLLMLLWLLARATSFHLITTFREMADHFGLEPGGVCSFTRDVVVSRRWAWLVHPRNNGLHLTHHLQPSVPYYRLHQAQRMLCLMPTYRARAHVRSSYVFGGVPVVAGWELAAMS